jgi:hypothetical protein
VRGDWVSFLDDDDLWSPRHLSAMAGALKHLGPEPANLVLAGGLVVDRQRHPLSRLPPLPKDPFGTLYRLNFVGTPSRALVKAALLHRLGGFDESLSVSADWDLWLRVGGQGRWAYTARPTVAYMDHSEGMHRRTETALQELKTLDKRYSIHERLGISLPDASARWLGRSFVRQGERTKAARWFMRSARTTGSWRDIARAGSSLVGRASVRRPTALSDVPSEMVQLLEAARVSECKPAATNLGNG